MHFDYHPVEVIDVEFRELGQRSPPSFFDTLRPVEAGAILAAQAALLVVPPWTGFPMRYSLMLVAIGALWLGLRSAQLRAFVKPAALMLAVLALVGCGRGEHDAPTEVMTAQEEATLDRSLRRMPRERSAPNPAVHDLGRHRRAQEAATEAKEGEQ